MASVDVRRTLVTIAAIDVLSALWVGVQLFEPKDVELAMGTGASPFGRALNSCRYYKLTLVGLVAHG